MMKRKELINLVRERVSGVYTPNEAAVVAYVIAESFFGFGRIQAVVEPDAEVDGYDEELMVKICEELAAHRPLQYVVGETEFCGMRFTVREGVLIPRPETEELVEWISYDNQSSGLRVLDIGTGSGAIAVALAKKLDGAIVTAVDISEKALEIAIQNAGINDADINFRLADALSTADIFAGKLPSENYDIVVSNPPYIPASEYSSMRDNVRKHEPREALFVPDGDPLLFYEAIAEKAKAMLGPMGRLYFEIHENFSDDVLEMLSGMGFCDVECRNDINGKPRMVKCVKRM